MYETLESRSIKVLFIEKIQENSLIKKNYFIPYQIY